MAHFRGQIATLRHLHGPRLRLSPQQHPPFTRWKSTFNRPRYPYPRAEQLQSRFPVKTFLFFSVLGGIAYFAGVRVTFGEHWTARIPPGHPVLHFLEDTEHVQHALEELDEHSPDYVSLFRDSDKQAAMYETWDHSGFAMTEDEAAEADIPLTHFFQWTGNLQCEDRYALGRAPGPGGDSSRPWNFWGVYDGHAGGATSFYLQASLIPFVSRALSVLQESSSSSAVNDSIARSFLNLDSNFMTRAKQLASWYSAAKAVPVAALQPAMAGSCALLACFDPQSSKLRVACTGDSRAVLGRWDPVNKEYVLKVLSVDQTGFNKEEVDRIMEEHPGEPDIINPEDGRLLGIAVTRAFGDHRWKWDNDFIRQVQYKFWGPRPRPDSKTPPYMTAEPVITETDIMRGDETVTNAGKADFMIMASDGLWDHISSEHAVELVQQWLEAKERGNGKVSQDPQLQMPTFVDRDTGDEPGVEYDVENGKYVSWKVDPKYFIVDDDNAAACLVKNAFGGNRTKLFMSLGAVKGPLRRNVTDDTTVMVVFFDKKKEAEKPTKKWWKPW